jgi:5-methyltetrahydrofolate--homocysteine methyltransferase
MNPFLEQLGRGKSLICDGGLGSMLVQRGLQAGECPESIGLSRPEVLEEIARLYFEAGAEIVTTNTFGASPLKLAQYGLQDRCDEINRSAVEAVRKVVGERAYVAASVGPSGAMLKPYGTADPSEVRDGFVRQVTSLIGAAVDVVLVETMIDLTEAKLAVQAVREVAPTIPVSAAMTFDATPRGFFTVMGVTIEKAAAELREAGANIVGSNCGNGIEKMIEIARGFRACGDFPVIIQSNAGLPELKDGQPVYPETPEFMAEKARELVTLGVAIIGGCCGTTPAHIRAIRGMMDSASD